jgi:MFS family permease
MYVALTQAASALPFFILALPAGAIGDFVDRRRLILFTEIWMVVVAVVLAVLTIAGRISPVLLLMLTFALSVGDAFETPTWRAVLPELVQKEDLPAASALNGIEFNFARAVGQALAGFVIAFAGIGTAFLLTPLSFFGVILVVPLGAVILVGGAAWTSFTSLFNVQVPNQTPDWVRARVLAVSMLVVQGAVAAGSAEAPPLLCGYHRAPIR